MERPRYLGYAATTYATVVGRGPMIGRALVVSMLLACAPEAPNCPAGPIELTDCFEGAYFADCGGSGHPRIACSDARSFAEACRWFSTACVPRGFRETPCRSGDVCCDLRHAPPPFDDDTYSELLQEHFGDAVWTRDLAAVIPVAQGDWITGASSVTCTLDGEPYVSAGPCWDEWEGEVTRVLARDMLSVLYLHSGFQSWLFWIEIDPERSMARACRFSRGDGVPLGCFEGVSPPPVDCAVSGSLELSDTPPSKGGDTSGLGLRGTVEFGDGVEVRLELTL